MALRAGGVTISAVVEQAAVPVGPAALLDELASGGTALLCGHVLARAEGLPRVEAAIAVAVDAGGRHLPNTERRFSCDTVVLGIGAVPVIELLDNAGCRVQFDGARGGVMPVLDQAGRTSVPGLWRPGMTPGCGRPKHWIPRSPRRMGTALRVRRVR